jgi:hypothetical protein
MTATEAYYDGLRDAREAEAYRRSMIDFFFAHGGTLSIHQPLGFGFQGVDGR